MEDKKVPFEPLFEKVKEYINTTLELTKLKTIDKASGIISALVVQIGIVFLLSFFFLFINIGLAYWIGELSGKIYIGFFIVSGFYLLLSLFGILLFKSLKRNLADTIIEQSLKS